MAPDIDRKLAAILSADVVGYSRLMAEDEQATIRTLTAYREQVATLVREHRGRVVDAPGDNLLAEFPTALDAVQAAVEAQRVIGARNADLPAERQMRFRIGVHLGNLCTGGISSAMGSGSRRGFGDRVFPLALIGRSTVVSSARIDHRTHVACGGSNWWRTA